MYKYILLITITLIFAKGFAQHKTITLYYPNDSTNVVSIANLDSMIIFICGASKVIYGGKDYNTVLIGNQCWLKENLDIGTMIPGTSNQLDNSILEKYCYNNNPVNCTTYGGLYQWDEAMQYETTEGAKGICPDGWHLPTLAEYIELFEYVVWDGNALLVIGQGQGTNTTGFSVMFTGLRFYDGQFFGLGVGNTNFWSSTLYDENDPRSIWLHDDGSISFPGDIKEIGYSVRCIKD